MRKLLVVIVVVSGITLLTPSLAAASKKSDQKIAEQAVLTIDDVPDVFVEGEPVDPDDLAVYPCGGEVEEAFTTAVAAPGAYSSFVLDESQDGYAFLFSESEVVAKRSDAKAIRRVLEDELSTGSKAPFENAVSVCMADQLEEFFALPDAEIVVDAGVWEPALDSKGNKGAIKGADVLVGVSATIQRTESGFEPEFYEASIVFGTVGRGFLQVHVVTAGAVNPEEVREWVQKMVTGLKPAR